MIASDAPLRLGSFLGSPGALRRELGLTRYASSNPYALMEDLAGLVLPYGEAGDWTDDVYAVWPDRSYGGDYQAEQFIRVQCADGRVLTGPAYYVYGACGLQNDVPPLVRNPDQPGDSSAVRPPSRRRPEPRDPGAEEGTATSPPPVVELIPEPEPARRPGVRTPGRLTERAVRRLAAGPRHGLAAGRAVGGAAGPRRRIAPGAPRGGAPRGAPGAAERPDAPPHALLLREPAVGVGQAGAPLVGAPDALTR